MICCIISTVIALIIMIIGVFCRYFNLTGAKSGAADVAVITWAPFIDENTLHDGSETARKLFGASVKPKSRGHCNKYEFELMNVQNHRANIGAKSIDDMFPVDQRPRGDSDVTAVKYFMEAGAASPIMLVDHCGELIVVDGVHRLCAAYLLNSDISYEIYDIVYTIDDLAALEYPYAKYYKTSRDAMHAFNAVVDYKLNIVSTEFQVYNLPGIKLLYEGRPQLIETSPRDYSTMNWMSDWFHECRYKCRRYDNPQSPIEYWAENKSQIIAQVINKPNATCADISNLSDHVYSKIIGCNNFRPGLMRGFIEKYGAKSVLDISAGWGDRLIGAIAAGVKYTGVDPADCVHVGYKTIVGVLAPCAALTKDKKSKYTLIKSGFVECELPRADYDLVFSSPPYFDLEIYDSGPMQSAVKYPEISAWFDGFLAPSLRKAFAHLITGGHMAINLNEVRGAGYVKKMLDIKFNGAKYLGVIGFADKVGGDRFAKQHKANGHQYKSPQPIWIWRREFKRGLFVNGAINALEEHIPAEYIQCEKYAPIAGHIYCGQVGKIHLMLPSTPIELNPDIIIKEFTIDDRILRVVMDNLLPGGTKQRAAEVFVKPGYEHIYAGPWSGFAQCALAIVCRESGSTCTIFSARDDSIPAVRARSYWANIKVMHAPLKQLQAAAESYSKESTSRGSDRILLPFGFDSSAFRDRLEARLISAISADIRDFTGTIWLAAGSGTLAAVLYRVFPTAKFALIQIGKKIWPDQLAPGVGGPRAKLYIADEQFYSDAELIPPWPSASNYDAKVYKFAQLYADSGDIIWNVAG